MEKWYSYNHPFHKDGLKIDATNVDLMTALSRGKYEALRLGLKRRLLTCADYVRHERKKCRRQL